MKMQNMTFLQVMMMILSLSLLLLGPLLVVESSSLTKDNITRGSTLSLNDPSPYWLSPSGNIAFGFYQLPPWSPGQYVVGIWFVNSSRKTLVWTANRYDLPLQKPSSIHFTNEGKLMLRRMPENKEKPLVDDIQEPVSYAEMHDDGNFIFYGSESQIVWESFDYPTNTILGGQKLRPGVDLFSGGKRLSVRQSDGLVAVYTTDAITYSVIRGYRNEEIVDIVFEIDHTSGGPITLNLDTSGNLYLDDGHYYYYLYGNKNQQRKQQQEEGSIVKEEVYIYRATLETGGDFNLYKERIDGNVSADYDKKSSSSLVRLWPKHRWSKWQIVGIICLVVIELLFDIAIVIACTRGC